MNKASALIRRSIVLLLMLAWAAMGHAQTPTALPPEIAARAAADPYIRAARELRERTGRDNALIYYQEASLLAPGNRPDEATEALLRKVVREGWSDEARNLLPYLRRWNAAVARVQQGAAVNFAEGIGAHSGMDTPVPNFLFTMTAARILVAQGRYYESAGQHEQALDRYLTTLRMGRDFGSRGNTLISGLISVEMQNIVHEALSPLVRSRKLDDSQLARARGEILALDSVYRGIVESLSLEKEMTEGVVRSFLQQARTADAAAFRHLQGQFGNLTDVRPQTRDDMIRMLEIYLEESESYYQAAMPTLAREPHEYDVKELDRQLDAKDASFKNQLSKIGVPRLAEACAREHVMLAKRRLLLTQIALERHRLQHGQYPAALEELRGAFLDELPTDPFSGQPFSYRVTKGGAEYTMYSLGPDKQDNPRTTYDPTNGTISPGVIY